MADDVEVFRPRDDVGFFQGPEDTVRFEGDEGRDGKVGPQVLFKGVHIAAEEPVRKDGRFLDVRAVQGQDHRAARFGGEDGIHRRFHALVEVHVLGIATSRSNGDICQVLDGYAGDVQQVVTTFFPGFVPVAADDFIEVAICRKDRIDQETRIEQGCGLLHIVVEGIIFQKARFTFRIAAAAEGFRQGHGVVAHDRFITGNARQDGFAAAAKPGHRMEGHGTGQDDLVGLDDVRIEIDVIAIGGRPDFGQLGGIAAVMADDLYALDHVCTADDGIFFRRMGPMRPLGRDDRNLVILDAGLVQFIDDDGQHLGRMDQAGNIADDDGDRIAGLDDIFQRRAANRMAQGLADGSLFIGDGVDMVAVQVI